MLDPRREEQAALVLRRQFQRFGQLPQRIDFLVLGEIERREIVVRVHIFGILRHRLAQGVLGLFGLAQFAQQGAEIVVGLRVAFADRQRILVGVDRTVLIIAAAQRIAEIVIRFGELGSQLDRLAISGGCLFEIPAIEAGNAEIVVSLRILGIEVDRLLQGHDGIGEISALALNFAQIGTVTRDLGRELDRTLEAGNAFLGIALGIEHDAENRMRVRQGGLVLDDLAADILGLFEAPLAVKLACDRDGIAFAHPHAAVLNLLDHFIEASVTHGLLHNFASVSSICPCFKSGRMLRPARANR